MKFESLLMTLLLLAAIYGSCYSTRSKRRLLDFRKMMKVFVRYNVKVNVVPYTSIFAFAMGFRGNWEIKPSTIIHPKKRIDQQQGISYTNYPSSGYAYNQYGYIPYNQYQNTQFYPSSYYQRAIHSAVQGAFDWHGLNGTACLLRVLCEVSLIHQDDIVSQILKVIFNTSEDPDFGCPEEVDCPVSLLHLLDHIFSGAGNTTLQSQNHA